MSPRRIVPYMDRDCLREPERRYRTHRWKTTRTGPLRTDARGDRYRDVTHDCENCDARRVFQVFPFVLADVFSGPAAPEALR